MEITVGSLFSGIGGLDLGLERAGMKVIWQSEIDKYCCKVLKKHWPEVPNHGNIKEIDWQKIQKPNIIAGGYPCQPFSTAGKRKGTQDPRHLWPWVRTAISELRPDYAILENVPGHLTMGGTEVIGALAEIGYDAEWRVVSAAGLGANHLRKRIIIVAYPNSERPHRTQINSTNTQQQTQPELARCGETVANPDSGRRCEQCQGQIQEPNARRRGTNVADTYNPRNRTLRRNLESTQPSSQQHRIDAQHEPCRCSQTMADANSRRCEQRESKTEPIPRISSSSKRNGGIMADAESSVRGCAESQSLGKVFRQTSESRERSSDEGAFGSWWQTEPNVGRVADGIPNRVDRLRGLGNAVVPQVAEYIGRLVMEQYN